MGEASADGGLPGGLRALVRLAAALAARDSEGVEVALGQVAASVKGGGLKAEEVEEALLQATLFVGYPAAMEAFRGWREVHGQGAAAPLHESPDLWRARGPMVLDQVYGTVAARLLENMTALHPELARWMVEEGYGRVLGRPGLALSRRELLVVALLAPQDTPRQLRAHLRGALRNGVPVEWMETMFQDIEPWLPHGDARERLNHTWQAVRERVGSIPPPSAPTSS
jgi:4-carboxymuconolactone decarboxylase